MDNLVMEKGEVNTMCKAEQVISAAQAHMGEPYVFGAWGERCTPANRRRRMRDDHPTIRSKCQVLNGKKSDCEGCKWADGALMFDCRGFTYWCLKQVGIVLTGQGATSQYNTSSNWVDRGTIPDMPDLVCCVFMHKDGKMIHTGLHIGGGSIIHCSHDVETGKISDRGWTHYAVPIGLYTAEELEKAGGVKEVTTMKTGSTGSEVAYLQQLLTDLGYPCGTIDGKYGVKTATAVRAFQSESELTVDGVAGDKTLTALMLRHAQAKEPDTAKDEAELQSNYERVIAMADRTENGAVQISLDEDTAWNLWVTLTKEFVS